MHRIWKEQNKNSIWHRIN